MARKPRIHRTSAFYHVMLRGNNKEPIFFSDHDRIKLFLLIQEGVERFGHRIHGFCLMHNHIHLIVQPADISLSKIIQHLAFRYTRYINRKEVRVGHLFQGRFKAILVDAETYLLELVRYMHLNPVRAGITTNPNTYSWSSHRAYLGIDSIPWLTTEWILGKISMQVILAKELYAAHIKKGMGEKMRPEFHFGTSNSILGSETFAQKALVEHIIAQKRKIECTLETLIQAVSCVLKLPITAFAAKERVYSQARGIVAYLVRSSTNISLTELASYFNHDISRTSRLANRIQQELIKDPNLANTIEEIQRCLKQSAKAQA